MKRGRSTTVSFRVNGEIRSLIEAARKPLGLSPGEYVRGVITQTLDQHTGNGHTEELIELRRALADLTAENQSLQQSLRRLSFVLLTQLGAMTPEAAREAIRHIFHPADAV